MKKNAKVISVLALLISGIFLTAFQVAQTDISGTWNLTVETPAGAGNPTLVLKQQNDTLITGTYNGLFGETPLTGTIKGNDFNLKIATDAVIMQYKGVVKNDSISGKVFFNADEIGEGTFTGLKEKK